MRMLLIALAAVSLVVAGCGGSGDAESEAAPSELPNGLECPNGEADVVTSVSDIGTDARGFASPRTALARYLAFDGFLNGEGSDLDASEFTGDTDPSPADRRAGLSYSYEGRKLAHVYLKRLDSGWLVVGHQHCRGHLP